MKRVACLAISGILCVLACGSRGRDGFADQNPSDPSRPGANGGDGAFAGAAGCERGGARACVGNDVHECQTDGGTGAFVQSCDATSEFCVAGACASTCEAASTQASNVGCEFWAADLDNEFSDLNDAAGQPWGVVVSNFGNAPNEVIIEMNAAALGEPVKVVEVSRVTLAPRTLKEIALPTREVDGSVQGTNDGMGTALTPNAFRIRSSLPIVAYQFNTLRSSYSNDASLLVPKNGLGQLYRVLGYPSANPISVSIPGIPTPRGIPDHSYVTVLGTQPGTRVKVTVSAPTAAGSNVPGRVRGEAIEQTLGPFDVLNVEAQGLPADLSGSIVEASAPVAVFIGAERVTAPLREGPPAPPRYVRKDHCCTDHIEEQLLPVDAYGRSFVVTRSPIRSRPGRYVEPDMLRFMGVAARTSVKTSLPPPDDAFTLEPGEVRDTWTTTDFVAEATEPLAVAQILVSQAFCDAPAFGGDPSLTVFPPVDQYRRDYLFNVPTSYAANFVVIGAPKGAKVQIDGAAPTGCVVASAGMVSATEYEARRCPVGEGVHSMTGDAAFGIVVYGYGSRASYAFVGGANVKKIYAPPAIPPIR